MVNGASRAIAFYEKAFGATELFRIVRPDDRIVHAEMRIGESVIMVGDADGPFRDPNSLHGSSVGLHVYVENVDTLFAQAVSVGAKVIQSVQDMFYGDRTCMLEDPFGHIWVLLTYQEDMQPEEFKKRGEALFKQGNA
jgi:PhnB protein